MGTIYYSVGLQEPKTKRQRLATDGGISDKVAQGYMETIWVPVKGHIVRATEEIEKDMDICEYQGEIYSNEEAPDSDYNYDLKNGKTLAGKRNLSFANSLSHSCNPNCKFVQDGDRVLVRTLRAVKKDKELTVDYGHQKKTFFTKCKCERNKCGGPKFNYKNILKQKKAKEIIVTPKSLGKTCYCL